MAVSVGLFVPPAYLIAALIIPAADS